MSVYLGYTRVNCDEGWRCVLAYNDTLLNSTSKQRAGMKPSELISQRLLTTSERLSQLDEIEPRIVELMDLSESDQHDFVVPIDRPLFKPTPSQVVFQNFTPFRSYEVLLSFRNVDKVEY